MPPFRRACRVFPGIVLALLAPRAPLAHPGAAQVLPAADGQAGAGTAVSGEAACRLWGRVTTVDGRVREGFLRWDRNGTHWADLLSGSRALPPERAALVSRVRDPDAPPRRRVLEVRGYRVSWDEPDPALAVRTAAAIRFAHLVSVQVFQEDAVLLTLNDGQVEEWTPDNSDLGPGMRGLVVSDGRGGREVVAWEALDRVVFEAAPAGVAPEHRRLHGTVEDRWGRRYTGWVAWDRDEALTADTLQGRVDGRDYAVALADIVEMAADPPGTRVSLVDGREFVLSGTNDVADGNRGVQVVDPGLGTVTVSWEAFRRVRFHEPVGAPGCHRAALAAAVPPWTGAPLEAAPAAPGDAGGDHAAGLRGTVRTRDGRMLQGPILWDGDEAHPWEQLDGEDRGVAFQVEMGRIAAIRRRSFREAEVVLRDGRTLALGGSNDVSEDNRGILVWTGDGAPPPAHGAGRADDTAFDAEGAAGPDGSDAWVLVAWTQLEEVRFDGDA